MTSVRSALLSSRILQRLVGCVKKPVTKSKLLLQHTAVHQPEKRLFITSVPNLQDKVKVTFLLADGDRQEVMAAVGDNLLDIIIDHDVDIDGFGACEGTLACSTCHLIFHQKDYDKIPDTPPTDEELDMLDLAYGLTDTSRLGCQVIVTKDMDGMEVQVPSDVSDARSGGL